MVLNRGASPLTVRVELEDLGDSTQAVWKARDLWAHADLGVFSGILSVDVPGHGVRLLRMMPSLPPPPPPPSPPQPCPAGFDSHAPGVWSNAWPCGYPAVPPSCPGEDRANNTLPLCGRKCSTTAGCVGFELFESASCWLFLGALKPPFTPYPGCVACVRSGGVSTVDMADTVGVHRASRVTASAGRNLQPEEAAVEEEKGGVKLKPTLKARATKPLLAGFQLGNGASETCIALNCILRRASQLGVLDCVLLRGRGASKQAPQQRPLETAACAPPVLRLCAACAACTACVRCHLSRVC